jgi:penicillin-insensitive murein DD-endopeptidase
MRSPALLISCIFALYACGPSPVEELTGQPLPHATPMGDDHFQGEKEQARGFYSNGSLVNPDLLPLEGFGFVKLQRPRQRGFGSHDLVLLLQETARQLQELHPSRDRVQIGDMSGQNGGFSSGHVSHQNGLDADVAFIRLNQTEQDPEDTRGFRETFVRNGQLTPNFDLERNWAYAKLLVATGRVQRVFVGEVIKRGLCAHVRAVGELESEHETLKRLRVIAGHTDHFHIRLTCPRNSPACTSQEEVPDTHGCS